MILQQENNNNDQVIQPGVHDLKAAYLSSIQD